MPKKETFYQVLSQAIRDFSEHGFDDPKRLSDWIARLRKSANGHLPSAFLMDKRLKSALAAVYARYVTKKKILKLHPGVGTFTVERIEPHLRAELDRRIMASADLIRLNREQAIEKTLQRFSGWASSQPPGGSRTVDRSEVTEHVWRSLRSLPFEERRLYIDQGHKLISNISAILAQQSGSIAGMWRSHWRAASYDFRPEHKERDEKIYAMRGNWAMEKGLMTKGPNGYLDEHEAAGFLPFCRCYITYLDGLSDLPADMLTQKGREALAKVAV